MSSWKERITGKLSRFLPDPRSTPSNVHADSRSSPSSIAAGPFSDHPTQQAVSSSPEEAPSTKPSSYSAYLLSFFRKSRTTVGKEKSNRTASHHGFNFQSLRSLPARFRSSSLKDNSTLDILDSTKGKSNQDAEISKETLELVSKGNSDISVTVQKVSAPQCSEDFRSSLNDDTQFITSELFEFINSSLPNIAKGCTWILIYSTWKHGISLRTLLRNCEGFSWPCLLIAGDMQGAVFGGFLDSLPKPTAKRKYQGTNQAFVFTTIHGQPRLFRATGENRYYCLCLNDSLAFGGGSHFALHLEEDLLHGTSGDCETFGSSCLTHSSEFELKHVELWAFTHVPRYPK